jgi:VCBS repeat-containing protein
MNRLSRTFFQALFLACTFVSFAAHAATTTEFRVLIDSDEDSHTGCSVTTSRGTVAGIDQILVTTVSSTDTSGQITSVARQVCSGGSFGSPISVISSPYPIGLSGGNAVVETMIPFSVLGQGGPTQLRVSFVVVTGSSSDSILTSSSSQPLIWPPQNQGRRRAIPPGGNPPGIILDGQTSDWGMMTPLVAGQSGGPSSPHFNNVFAFSNSTNVWFRFDATIGGGSVPVANDDTYTVRQGKSFGVAAPGVLANDSDPNNAPLTATATSTPTSGTLALDPSGSFTYVNNGSSAPVDTFKYKASNGTATSNEANVTINVTPDRRPIGVADAYNVAHAGTLTVAAPGVLSNDVDPDNDRIKAVLASNPAHGTLTLASDGSFIYTHDGSNTLVDTFTYRADDSILTSSPTTVTITVGPDQPPVSGNDNYTVAEGGTLNVPAPGIFTNDGDPDTPTTQWTVQIQTAPTHGTLTMGTNGAFNYTHDGGETTADSFTYKVSDGILIGNLATVSITITPVNDAPVAVADGYSTLEDGPLTVPAGTGVLANDTDADTAHSSLTAILVSNVTHGTLTLNPDGSFNYNPAANYNGSDSFTYKAYDGSLDSNVVTVALTITAVNDVPSFTSGGPVTVNEDNGAYSAAWATGVSAGPADESSQTLAFVIDSNNNAALFSVAPVVQPNGTLTFTPAANANGSATITLHITDNGGTANGGVNASGTQSFTINVTAVDDAPTNTVPGAQTINEDATFTFTGATAISVNDIDLLAGNLTVTLSVPNGTLTLGGTAGLTVSNNGTGSVQATGTVAALNAGLNNTVYAPNADFNGSATVTVSTNDNGNTGTGGPLTTTSTIAFTITGVNDAPVITRPATATTDEDVAFTFNGGNVISIADVDAGSGTISVALSVSNGSITLSGTTGLSVTGNGTNNPIASGTLTDINAALDGVIYTPSVNYNGSDTLTIGVNDNGNTGSGGSQIDNKSVAITINAINDQAILTGNDTVSYTEDGAHVVIAPNGVVVDPDNANLTGALISISGNADGPGNDILEFDVTGTNITGNYVANAENLTLSGSDTLANYQQVIRSIKFYTISDTPLTAMRYIDFYLNDGSGNGPNHTNFVNVTANNDAPVITRPATATTNEDTPFTFSGGNVISIADPDAGSGSISVTLAVTNGTLTLSGTTGLSVTGDGTSSIAASGTLTDINAALNGLIYASGANYNGADTLTIGVNDNGNTGAGGAKTDSKTTAITINAVNDAPVAVTDSYNGTEDNAITATAGTGVLANDTDIDTPHASLTAVLNVGPTNASAFTLNADGSFSYTPNANFNGTDSFTYHAFDGALSSNIVSVSLNLSAVNDPPVITRPATISPAEDVAFSFSGGNVISIADVDAGAGTVSLTLGVTNGTLTLASTAGLSVTGDGTNIISASGTLANLNTALNGMQYLSNSNYNGPDTLLIDVNDGGNAGAGGNQTDSKTTAITVTAVNDAPVNGVPAATQTFDEDTPLTFSSGNGNAITVADVDVAAGNLQVTLATTAGTITLGGTTGLTVTGNGTGSVQLTGTVANLNTGLAGTVFTPTTNLNGAQTISVTTSDLGNTGSGGAQQDIDTINLSITAVNDGPSITRPASVSTNEDNPFTFNGGNVVSVSDVDAAPSSVQVSLGVSNGKITLNGVAGLSFTVGDGTLDPTMTFSGTPANVNNALNGMVYTPNGDFFGGDTLTINVDDLGHTGTGGNLTDSKSTSITVNAVNDAPVAAADSYSVNEDTALTPLAAAGVLANDTDVDTPHASLTAVLNVGPTHAQSFTLNSDGSFSYTPVANYNGPDSFTYHAFDGALSSGIVTASITVNAVNDAPVNNMPSAAQSMNQDTTLTMTGATNIITTSDVDAGGATVRVTLTGSNGTMTLSGIAGLSFSAGDGIADATMTFDGTIAAINTAMNGMQFTSSPGYFGTASIAITTNDLGNTGLGGNQITGPTSVNITVVQVNQPPVNSVPGPQTVIEDTPFTFSVGNGNAITTSDPDAGASTLPSVNLTVLHGTLHLVPTAGVTINNNDTASVTGTGTIANLNTAMNGLVYTPVLNYNAGDTLTLLTNDNGATGPGGAKTDSDPITLNFTAVNDKPVITRPVSVAPVEDTAFSFTNTISIADVDVASGNLTVTLGVVSGTLNLSTTASLTVSGQGTNSITATGTLANLNTALTNMTYQGTLNFNGGDTLTIGVDDLGNTGTGGNQTDSKTTTITVSAVNDAPVNSVPAATQTFNEDTTRTFSAANGNAITVSDVDSAAGTLTTTFTSTAGTIHVVPTAGVVIGTNDTASVTATGTVANLNTAFDGLVFTPTLNLNGAQTITMSTSDNGNTGSGGAQTDNGDVINLSITAVNDAPTFSAFPGLFTVNEDTPITFSAGNAITVADVDVAGGNMALTVASAFGTVHLVGAGVVNNDTANVTFTGTLAQVNAALNGAVYTPTANHNNSRGAANVTVTVNDNGNTGGGALQVQQTVGISYTAVNDTPVAAAKAFSVHANMKIVGLTINLAGNGTGDITDADIGDGAFTDSFTIASLTPVSCTGCVISNLNAAAGTFDFEPTPGFTGGALTLQYTVTDNGNPGPGATSAPATITLNISGPVIWFVDSQNGSDANTGLLGHPFKTLTAVAAVDASGHRVFLNRNNGTLYTGTLAMSSNEWLIGEGAVAVNFDTYFGLTVPAGTIARPSISGTNPVVNAAVTFATNGKVDGVDFDGAVASLSATSATTFTVNVGRFRRTGSGAAITLAGAGNTGNYDFKSVSASGSAGAGNKGVSISNLTGHFVVAGTDASLTPNGGTVSGYGANGMEFISVANAGSNAITLNKMTLNANGVSETVVGSASTCGGDLINNNNLACVANLYLQGVTKIALNTVTISNSGQMGIVGNNVTDFTLTSSSVNNNGSFDTFPSGTDEDGLNFQNLKGTCSITDTNMKDNAGRQLYVENDNGAVTLSVTKTGGTMTVGRTSRPPATTTSAQGILFSGHASTNMTLQVDGLTVQNNFGNGIQSNIQGTSSLLGFIKNSSFNINAAGINLQSNNASTIGASGNAFLIQGNPVFTGNQLQGINVGTAAGSSGGVTVKISSNVIGTAGSSGSACDIGFPTGAQENCAGISLSRNGTNPFAVTVSNNQIRQFGNNGINLNADLSGSLALAATGNTIAEPYFRTVPLGASPFFSPGTAITTNVGTSNAAGLSACIDISGNTIDQGIPGTGWDPNNTGAAINTRTRNNAVVSIPGYSGGNVAASVQTFVANANTMTVPVGLKVKADIQTGGSFANGAGACSTP